MALIVAIGGSAYAASKVGGKDLKSYKVRSAGQELKAGESADIAVNCKKGERYISGGYDTTPADAPPQPLSVFQAGPNFGSGNKLKPVGFAFGGTNTGTGTAPLTIFAVCLKK